MTKQIAAMFEAARISSTNWFADSFFASEFLTFFVCSIAIFAALALYFAPTIYAAFRRSDLYWTIFFMNMLFGWLIIGWVLGFVLAYSPRPVGATSSPPAPKDPPSDDDSAAPS